MVSPQHYDGDENHVSRYSLGKSTPGLDRTQTSQHHSPSESQEVKVQMSYYSPDRYVQNKPNSTPCMTLSERRQWTGM